jgi:predicted O-linked N-acetylglucosamine transferase (SPINDLY family)
MSLHDQAAMAFQQGRRPEAERLCGLILATAPEDFLGHFLLGLIDHDRQRFEEALGHYRRALATRPDDAMLLFNRGNTLFALGRTADALADYDRSVTLAAGFAPAWNNRANTLRALGRGSEAIASYGRVLALDPAALPVRQNRADLYWQMHRFAEALADYEIILRRNPGSADTWKKRGDLLRALGRVDAALGSYAEAAALDPEAAATWLQWGSVLWLERGALAEATAKVARAVALDPGQPYAQGFLLHLKLMACDWDGLADSAALLDAGVRDGRPVVEPFAYLPVSSSPADLKACAEIFVRDHYPAAPPVQRPARGPRTRLRIGYLSGEFQEQATAHLTAGLYECHDRERFEVIAFDNGPDDGSALRQRLLAAFDGHVDITKLSDRDAAARIAAEGVDILVSLNGLFGRHRTSVFAMRPAPLQVNYLGFPGTMGAGYMDYIIADRIVIPEGEQRFFPEQVVWLPRSYQINDDRRIVAPPPLRAECGLPQNGFVFCNFNNAYKHNPQMFALWLRLLGAVEGSVLWLLESNAVAPDNLRRTATAAGIAPERLIFAPFQPAAQNLARLALADLALDALPVGAHTGASDLLWAGTPLLTCYGTAFSGRVAASLLGALDMPELVTETLADYEALALKLEREPQTLKALREKLQRHRTTAPLFDTAATTRSLEAAYARMWDIHQRGEAPRGFAIDSPQT